MPLPAMRLMPGASSSHLCRKLEMRREGKGDILWRRTLDLQRNDILSAQKNQTQRVLLLTLLNDAYA